MANDREPGTSADQFSVVSDDDYKVVDDNLGLQLISIRLTKPLIDQLKGLARLEGIGYQPLIRQVLTKYAKDNEHKLDVLLSAADAAIRADKLFAHAIQLREQIPGLTQYSNERIFAEADYSKALGEAQCLFAQALDDCQDPILQRHIKLRISQIADLCQQELQSVHDGQYGKRT